ncbi:hypothetical protein ACEWPN_12560 [Yoonia sp. R2-816]
MIVISMFSSVLHSGRKRGWFSTIWFNNGAGHAIKPARKKGANTLSIRTETPLGMSAATP